MWLPRTVLNHVTSWSCISLLTFKWSKLHVILLFDVRFYIYLYICILLWIIEGKMYVTLKCCTSKLHLTLKKKWFKLIPDECIWKMSCSKCFEFHCIKLTSIFYTLSGVLEGSYLKLNSGIAITFLCQVWNFFALFILWMI